MKSNSPPMPAKESRNNKKIDYSCRIGNHLQKRLSQHILKLESSFKDSESKQTWIEDAIREKLIAEEQQNLGKNNHLHLKVDVELWKVLSAKIEKLKTIRISSSKKEFIEEAILEKLDREEQSPKKILQKMTKLSSKKKAIS